MAKSPGRPKTVFTPEQQRLRDQRVHFSRSKAQAHYRNEQWLFSFEEWQAAWGPQWDQRGKSIDQYCMIRIDPAQPWTASNVEVISRYDFLLKKYDKDRFRYTGGRRPGTKNKEKQI